MGLILQLKVGDTINIGGIRVKYSTAMPSDQIKLHIEAPKEISIVREEGHEWAGKWRTGSKRRVYIPGEEEGNK